MDACCIFGDKGNALNYRYWAYGLKVRSQIPFPELFPIGENDQVDLEIVLGDVPQVGQTEKGFHSNTHDITPNEYRITIKDVASYHVYKGKRITISALLNADLDSVRLFCLSNAFAAVLQQRKSIPLHCSAIIDKGELVLIFGASGAGKSTTLAMLIRHGYKPFSDDVCVPVFHPETNELELFSSYPMMKFWKETLDIAALEASVDRRILPGLEKYGIYFHEDFVTASLKPKMIILLGKDDQIEMPAFQPVAGIELFQRLEEHAYRGEYLGFSALKKEHFTVFSQMATQSRCFVLNRPYEGNFVQEVADKIINLLA